MNQRAKWAIAVASMGFGLASTMETARAQTAGPSPSFEQRLRRIEDREAIEKLLITYGQFLDRQDFAGYSALFASDGVWEGGIGSAKGPREILAMLETVYGRTARRQYVNSYHIMSDIIIEVDGDTATSWSRWTWLVEAEDGKPAPQRSGHYEDELVRENGEWKFQHRLTVTELPTPEKDTEAAIFRTDHRGQN